MNLEYIIRWDDLSWEFQQSIRSQLAELIWDKLYEDNKLYWQVSKEFKEIQEYIDLEVDRIIKLFTAKGEIHYMEQLS